MKRTKYRFAGSDGTFYYWVSVLPVAPGDRRYARYRRRITRFWDCSEFTWSQR